jgi:hypothetical protein
MQDKSTERKKIITLYLVGISVQCAHFLEEYLTGFYEEEYFPPRLLFGLKSMSVQLFVAINIVGLTIFILAALGFLNRIKFAEFIIWFFAIAMVINGLVHPFLALMTFSYFSGTITAPFNLFVGLCLLKRLFVLRKGSQL